MSDNHTDDTAIALAIVQATLRQAHGLDLTSRGKDLLVQTGIAWEREWRCGDQAESLSINSLRDDMLKRVRKDRTLATPVVVTDVKVRKSLN